MDALAVRYFAIRQVVDDVPQPGDESVQAVFRAVGGGDTHVSLERLDPSGPRWWVDSTLLDSFVDPLTRAVRIEDEEARRLAALLIERHRQDALPDEEPSAHPGEPQE